MGTKIEAVVVGGSSGALEALLEILPALPASLALPVALVVHLPPHRPSSLVEVLSQRCALRVKEGEDKEPMAPSTVYVAPPDYHLLVERTRCLSLSVDPPVYFSRPSIDVLFDSAAEAYGPSLLGILLTGANEDGASGLARIRDYGGTVLVQSPATSRAPTMPASALRLVGPGCAMPLGEIGPYVAGLVRDSLALESRG
jgi:two-component system chemotaxis response regulator CheB